MSIDVRDRINPLTIDNPFAHDTMGARIPRILGEVQAINPDYPPAVLAAIDRLRAALLEGQPIAMLDALPVPASDYDEWQRAYDAQRAKFEPLTWHNAEWFFAETFVYRHLIQAVRWHETARDPFASIKQGEIEGQRFLPLAQSALDVAGSFEEKLDQLLGFDLWGNRVDLSHPASDLADEAATADELLVDDRAAVVRYLADTPPARAGGAIHLLLDNAGTELAMDLVLADFLLAETDSLVVLHVKPHPTFVSDAIIPDVWTMIGALEASGGSAAALAGRLRAAWAEDRLRLVAHPVWTGSRFLWDLPATLRRAFEVARLVIVKGDANYRRVMGDTVWPDDVTFADVLHPFPAPVLALRSSKCDVAVGLPPAIAHHLDATQDGWRVTGRYGMIQFTGAK